MAPGADLASVCTPRMLPEADFMYIQQRRMAPGADLASVCTVGTHSRADFVYIHRRGMAPGADSASVCTPGMPPEADFVYIHQRGLRKAVRIESNETIEGREMPDQVGHDVDKTKRSGRCGYTKKPLASLDVRGFRKTAATYSPTWWGSTIGDGELNFSVRNGKRWILTAIATAIFF